MEKDRFGEIGRDVQVPETSDSFHDSRRRFFRSMVGVSFLVAAAVPGVVVERGTKVIKVIESFSEVEDPAAESNESVENVERASELTDRAVGSFGKIFNATGERIFFLDDDYIILGGESFIKPSKKAFKKLVRAKKTPHKTYGAFLQAWFNEKRRELKERYPEMTLSLTKGEERPEMTRGTGAIAEASENMLTDHDETVLADTLFGNFNLGLSQTDFAADYPELIEYVSRFFVFGVAAHETKYRNLDNGTARGLWQFTSETARECGLQADDEKDERIDYAKSSQAAASCVNKMYLYFKKGSPVIEIMDEFAVPAEDFLVPCLVNAYHSGMGNVASMLLWFQKTYTRASFEAEFGQKAWGKDLYFLMSKLYRNSGESGSYKDESRVYYLATSAMYKALTDIYYGEGSTASILPPAPSAVATEPVTRYAVKRSETVTTKRNLVSAVLTTLVSAVSVSALSVTGMCRIGNQKVNRRQFLTRAAVISALCVGSTVAGRALKDDEVVIENK